MPRLVAYFLLPTGGFLSQEDGLMGDFYLASVGEFSRAPKDRVYSRFEDVGETVRHSKSGYC